MGRGCIVRRARCCTTSQWRYAGVSASRVWRHGCVSYGLDLHRCCEAFVNRYPEHRHCGVDWIDWPHQYAWAE